MKSSKLYQIGTLAQKANVNIDTIRYYEKRNLLIPKSRKESSFRMYDDESLKTIRFIKHAQELGFQLEEIRDLIKLRSNTTGRCQNVRKRAIDKLEDVEAKILTLKSIQKNLKKLIEECDQRKLQESCPIIEGMEDDE
jgi:Hg(II)-responsive transcriptional regulator